MWSRVAASHLQGTGPSLSEPDMSEGQSETWTVPLTPTPPPKFYPKRRVASTCHLQNQLLPPLSRCLSLTFI